MQDEKILNAVNVIISKLQSNKWENHSNQLLISSQGKLATYMSNVGAMVANAEYEYRLKELNHEQYEQDCYFKHRRDEGMSQQDAKSMAKLDAFAKEKTVFDAKHKWQTLRSILKAMESLSVACSTALKHQQIDRNNSNYQGN